MISRKIEEKFKRFYSDHSNKALLVTGARQVGKTYIIRRFAEANFENCVEINFLENKIASELFSGASNASELLLRLSAVVSKPLVPDKTIIFLDEVQECKEIITAIKFLVEEGSYRYILSGSMLGVELKDIKSVPVGYMDVIEMFPLDFEEFAYANGVSRDVISSLSNAFYEKNMVDDIIHEKMMSLFRLYLIVGGMPAVVQKYLETNNIREVIAEQKSIINLYKMDIGKYDPSHKLYLDEIFELIPSELNAKNKRFIMKDLHSSFKLSRHINSFLWLKDAGVALPVYSVAEPKVPLLLSKASNCFKLFLADVGLLAAMYMNDIQVKILNKEKDINFGSVYENVAATELRAHGFSLYYFNSKKQGEIDFLIERNGNVVPVEIKSGKDFTKHAALSSVIANSEYDIKEAMVFYNGNIAVSEKVVYYPIYMLMFVAHSEMESEMIYKINIDELK